MLQLNNSTHEEDYRAAGLECRLLIQDARGRLLLTRGLGSDPGGEWMLPGGRVCKGEAVAQAAVRLAHELFEILVWPNCIVSVSDSALVKPTAADRVAVTFAAVIVSGEVKNGHRRDRLRWCSRTELPGPLSAQATDALSNRGALEFRTPAPAAVVGG